MKITIFGIVNFSNTSYVRFSFKYMINPLIPIISVVPEKEISDERKNHENKGFIVQKQSPPVLAM